MIYTNKIEHQTQNRATMTSSEVLDEYPAWWTFIDLTMSENTDHILFRGESNNASSPWFAADPPHLLPDQHLCSLPLASTKAFGGDGRQNPRGRVS